MEKAGPGIPQDVFFLRILIKNVPGPPNRPERRDVLIYGKGKDPGGSSPPSE